MNKYTKEQAIKRLCERRKELRSLLEKFPYSSRQELKEVEETISEIVAMPDNTIFGLTLLQIAFLRTTKEFDVLEAEERWIQRIEG